MAERFPKIGDDLIPQKVKRGRGRPRKKSPLESKVPNTISTLVQTGRDSVQERIRAQGSAAGVAGEAARTLDGLEGFLPPQKAKEGWTDETLLLMKEKRVLEAALDQTLREAALADFWIFMTEILYCTPSQREHYIESFHRPICKMLQALLRGENLMIVIPREARKSYILRAFVVWLILRDFNIRIQIVSVTQDKAKKIATTIRDMFLPGTPGMEMLHRIFPECVMHRRGRLRTSQQFVHERRTINSPDPTVFSTFLGSSSTGSRADLMLVDDGWDNRTLENPEIGVKIFKKFLSLVPLVEGSTLGKYKNIIILATPWKHYDPCSILLGNKIREMDREVGAEVGKIPFKAYIRHSKEDPERLCEACPKHVVDAFPHGHPDWDKGQPILYPIFDSAALEDKRNLAMMDPAQGEEFFLLQYQCVYSFAEGRKFQPEWFVRLDQPGWAYATRKVLCIDDASKDFQTPGVGDFSVALMGEFNELGVLLVRYGLRSNRWTRDQFLSEILTWCKLVGWWPEVVAKEKAGVDTFLTDVEKAFRPHWHRPMLMKPLQRGGGKAKLDLIAGSLQTPMERREILFGSACPLEIIERAKYELVNLGKTLNDDVADTLAEFMHPEIRMVPLGQRPIENVWTVPELGLYHVPGREPLPDLPVRAGLRTVEFGLPPARLTSHGSDPMIVWDPDGLGG